ncbi:hypothetical protein ACTHGU_17395 [Chitinophagaceae bacterium MMS25-I14]
MFDHMQALLIFKTINDMPVNNLMPMQLNPQVAAEIISNLNIIIGWLHPFSTNLTPEERQRYGSINEQNKLLVNKVNDYHTTQPSLSTPDVDWTQYQQTLASRTNFAAIEQLLAQLMEICSDPRILHDYSLYQNALIDYDYTKYKANSTAGGVGFTTKMEEIKQFFPNGGGHENSDDNSAPKAG